MDNFSVELKYHLQQFLRKWEQEKKPDQTLQIVDQTLILKDLEISSSISTEQLLKEPISHVECELINEYKLDLSRQGSDEITFPAYLDQPIERQLHVLLEIMNSSSFNSVHGKTRRLETYYYFGSVLEEKGWSRKVKKIVRESLQNRTNEQLRRAKRVYELFTARGLFILYTVQKICPSKLAFMKEDLFYDELIPEAKRLRLEDLNEVFNGVL